MFSSRNKKAYQRIDDDFDQTNINGSCSGSLLEQVYSQTAALFTGDSQESQSLMHGDTGRTYQQSLPRAEEGSEYVIHGPPLMASSAQETNRHWEHIDNLDEFFTHIYEYHQNGGLLCIQLSKLFSLLQFVFVVSLTTFFTQCIDYDVLFANKNTTTSGQAVVGKHHFGDAVIPSCASKMNPLVYLALIGAIVYWVVKVVKNVHYLIKMQRIKIFYSTELKIDDYQLSNLTWHAIVKKICEVQPKLQLMIQKERMTSIDIYHRILRYKHYMVALVNKRILKPIFHVPLLGDVAYLPNGLKEKIERVLFHSSTSAWDGPNLKQACKEDELEPMVVQLEKDCKFYGFVYLVLIPLLLPFQVMQLFFSLAEIIKRSPSAVSKRRYSNYGRYLVRHFNELEHELCARLNRSHVYSSMYVDQFFSPVSKIIAKNVAFVAAAIAGVLAILGAWDEDVFQIEHVLTVVTVGGTIHLLARGMIPDENMVWQPEVLMKQIASELHYIPIEWKGHAHTSQVREEFDQLFQMEWMVFLLELTSPIFTPFLLLFWLRPKCRTLVTFFHDYTKTVDGLGDVCSFALMDVKMHGDPAWNAITKDPSTAAEDDHEGMSRSMDRAEDGKTELSVLHFKTTNPEWCPPRATVEFLETFKGRMIQDASQLHLPVSTLAPLGTIGGLQPEPITRNALRESISGFVARNSKNSFERGKFPYVGEGMSRIDGPLASALVTAPQTAETGSVIGSIYHEQPDTARELTNSLRASGVDMESAGADMRLQSIYLRELREDSQVRSRANFGMSMTPQAMESMFALPGARNEELLIDVDHSLSASSSYQQRSMYGSAMDTRSRLLMRTDLDEQTTRNAVIEEHEENEEEEDEGEGRPPEFYSS